MVKLQFRGLKS